MNTDKRQKLFLVVLALSCAVGALWIQHYSLADKDGLRAEAHFKNPLLGEVVPFEALLIKVGQAQMRSKLRQSLVLERVENEPTVLSVSVAIDSPEQATTDIKEVQTALSAVTSEFATAEARETAKNIRKLAPPSGKSETSREPLRSAGRKRPLTDDENQTAFRLRMEREDLEQYLRGGPEPTWLASRLDKKLYERAGSELDEARRDLDRLKHTFTPQSEAVKAQESEVKRLAQTLKQNREQLARALLDSQKTELAALENKALSSIKENARRARVGKNEAPIGSSASGEWTDQIADELDAEQKALEGAAQFVLVSEITISQYDKEHYWMRMVLWLSAAVFLLMALFKPESPNLKKTADLNKLALPDTLPNVASLKQMPSVSLTAEPLLAQLIDAVRTNDGSKARRFLVLGTSQTDARPVVTVRLAKTLSAMGEDVRLVDFDLKGKLLSSKLGNYDTAGVADMLSSQSGRTDEFFAPLSGTSIEFAPAGNTVISELTPEARLGLRGLLRPRKNGILVVDASFDSPVHALLDHVEAVICVTSADNKWDQHQQEVLLQVKDAQKPIWGLIQGDKGLFPFT